MPFAFVAATSLPLTGKSSASTCVRTPSTPSSLPSAAPTTVTMRCRRDLKKEKSLRNLEFARSHRKRVVKRYNRRAAQEAVSNEDNEYLSSIYGTMRFGAAADKEDKH